MCRFRREKLERVRRTSKSENGVKTRSGISRSRNKFRRFDSLRVSYFIRYVGGGPNKVERQNLRTKEWYR